MKKILFISSFIILPFLTNAQIQDLDWGFNSSNIYNLNSGDVSIGTQSTGAKLRINAPTGRALLIERESSGYFNTIFSMGLTKNGTPPGMMFSISSNNGSTYTPSLFIQETGRIGIGINNPLETLHLNGSLRGNQSGAIRISTGTGYIDIGPKNTSWAHFYTDRPRFFFAKGITVDQGLIGSHNENLQLQTSGTTRMTIVNSNGNVGIGTASPSYKLQAQGDIYSNGGWVRVSGSKGLYFQSYGGGLYMSDATWIRTYGNKSFYHNTGTMRTDGTFQVGPSGDRFIVNSSGNAGIGITSPTEKLDINGTARLRGLTPDNAQSRVLVSDSNGKLFWRDASTLGGNSNQTLSLSSNSLSISSGNSVDLSGYLDNTDTQMLSLSGNTLSISNGNSVDLNFLDGGDNLGNHIAVQNILPNTDNAYDLGSSSTSFKDIYYSGTIYQNGYEFLRGDLNHNLAIGADILKNLTSGLSNIGIGVNNLSTNSSGSYNTAIGSSAAQYNSTGSLNTAIGQVALGFNTTGSGNTAVGSQAMQNNNIGSYNVALGYQARPFWPDLDNSVAIGYQARTFASNQVVIGNSSVTLIGGQVSWSTLSDGRFKKNLKEDIHGLDFINSLKPVSYQVDKDKLNTHLGISDSVQIEMKKLNAKSARSKNGGGREIGFVGQEVVDAMRQTGFEFNGVHIPENENDHYTIRYAEFVVPLVKAVQELSAIVEKQQEQITSLQQSAKEDQSDEITPELGIQGAEQIELFQNIPNPFDQSTDIRMVLPNTVQQADLIIYNLEGKQIQQTNVIDRGQVAIDISAGTLDAGMYIYALIVDGQVIDQKRMILTK